MEAAVKLPPVDVTRTFRRLLSLRCRCNCYLTVVTIVLPLCPSVAEIRLRSLELSAAVHARN